jgi:SEC-C motif-containing protein
MLGGSYLTMTWRIIWPKHHFEGCTGQDCAKWLEISLRGTHCELGTGDGSSTLASAMNLDSISTSCPCGLPATQEACCGRYITGFEAAPTPEALMRSRYTAFAMGTKVGVGYLLATHHPEYRPSNLERDLGATMGDTHWTSLQIRSSSSKGDAGVVEFVAGYREDGQIGEMRERSQFLREKGLWLYTTGS